MGALNGICLLTRVIASINTALFLHGNVRGAAMSGTMLEYSVVVDQYGHDLPERFAEKMGGVSVYSGYPATLAQAMVRKSEDNSR